MSYEFYYSGPLIFKSRLTDEELRKLIALCKKDKKQSWNKNLAGLIEEEYRIGDQIALKKILDPHLLNFKAAYENWYQSTFKDISIVEGWVNFMKAYEHNPIHTHTQCDFSSVIYLSFPKSFKKEIQNTVTSGTKPGDINFFINAQDTPFYINRRNFTPQVADFLMFPASLPHFVNGFKSKGERISVAINFKIS
jgi:hypothetical protein|tara:strand:+ start:432 stop:1013 length:582 start_codon:yes stop_codon:yes gene_type:complete